MSQLFIISDEELNSDKWAKAREMCARYGYDIHEVAAGIANFRITRAEARAKALSDYALKNPPALPHAPASLVHWATVKQFWDTRTQRWTMPDYVYIGRAMTHLNINMPASPFGNPFCIEKDTDEARTDAIDLYADWILQPAQAHLLHQLDELRGKTLVCWCYPRRCHGEVLIKLMQDKPSYAEPVPESPVLETKEGTAAWQPALKIDAF